MNSAPRGVRSISRGSTQLSSKETLSEMERLFYAWPETRMPDGTSLSFTPENCKAIIAPGRSRA
jgi:hypothetical protein